MQTFLLMNREPLRTSRLSFLPKEIVYRCADSNTRWAGSGYHIVIYDQDTDNSHDVLSEGYLRSI